MLIFLVACNVLAGTAVGLAFRARAIVIAAPIMAAFTLTVLLMYDFGMLEALLWLCLCLFLGQLAFLLVTVADFRAPKMQSEDAQHGNLSKNPES